MRGVKGLYQKRGWWYFQPPQQDGVRPKAVALRTKDQKAALLKVIGMKRDRMVDDALNGERMDRLIELHKVEQRDVLGRAPKTVHHANTTLKMISKEWGNPKVSSITTAKVDKWRHSLAQREGRGGRKMSPATIAAYVRTLSSFMTFCVNRGAVAIHPVKGMRIQKVKKTRRQAFCYPHERDALLAAAVGSGDLDLALFLHVGFFAGLRPGEIMAMEWDWVFISQDGRTGSITVQQTEHWKPKDRELRTIPMHQRLLCFMRRYPVRGKYVFAPGYEVWREPPAMRYHYVKRFNRFVKQVVPRFNVGPYTLRHSFATHMAMGGAQPVEIAALLGDDVRVVIDNYIGFMPSQATKVNLIR